MKPYIECVRTLQQSGSGALNRQNPAADAGPGLICAGEAIQSVDPERTAALAAEIPPALSTGLQTAQSRTYLHT